MNSALRSFKYTLLLMLCCIPLRAQQTDRRLSPPDKWVPVYVAGTEIEGGAVVGSRALVVWGTTHHYGADTAAASFGGELRVQLLERGVPLGPQRLVTGPDARPATSLAVVNLPDRFMILWSDRRAVDPGIYYRLVDTAGSFIGDEALLAAGDLLEHDTLLWVNDIPGGFRLFWSDVSIGVRRGRFLEIDSNGAPRSAVREVSLGNFDDDLSYSSLPGVVIHRERGGKSRFIHAGGAIDPRPIPDAHLFNPFYLRPDTSLVTIDTTPDGHQYLAFYRSLFDTVDTHRVALPAWSSVLHHRALGMDSAGNPLIYLALSREEKVSEYQTLLFIYHVRWTVLPNDSLADSTWLGHIVSFAVCCPSQTLTYSGNVTGETFLQGDDNIARMTFSARTIAYVKGDINPEWKQIFDTVYTAGERLAVVSTALVPYAWTDHRARIALRRLWDEDSSIVSARIDNVTATLAAPFARRDENLRQLRPGIALWEGTPLVTWTRGGSPVSFGLARFDAPDTTAPVAPYLPDPVPPRDNRNGGHWTSVALYPGAGSAITTGTFDYTFPDPNNPNTPHGASRYFVAIPTTEGWKSILASDDVDYRPQTGAIARNPENGELSVAALVGLYKMRGVGRYLFDSTGREIARMTPVPGLQAIVPVAGRSMIAIAGRQATRLDDTTVLGEFTFRDSTGPGTTYRRLLGDRFLRLDMKRGNGSGSDSVMMELFDLQGHSLRSTAIPMSLQGGGVAVAQRPSDSALLLIRGGAGVHLTMLDDLLGILIADTVVSATRDSVGAPFGEYVGDTLYLAWEDFRNGAADIYGTTYPYAPWLQSGVERPGNPSVPFAAVAPVPARDHVWVTVDLKGEGTLGVEYFDELGRRVRADRYDGMSGGNRRLKLDLRGLYPGIFTLVITSGAGDRVLARIIHLD